ncbi:MAG: cobalamin biosynthesis protein [Streptosporangiaceae bacterium]
MSRRYMVGVGAVPGVSEAELRVLVEGALAEAGVAVEEVRALATLDRRAGEPAIARLALLRGWELLGFSAAALAKITVPSPSERVREATGTASVAEAAALAAAHGGELVVGKKRSAGATVAVARVCGTF